MFSRQDLANKPFLQLILILLLCLIAVILFTLIGGVIAAAIYGVESILVQNMADPNMVASMKLLQLFSAIGLFLIPPLIYGLFRAKNPFKALDLHRSSKPVNYFLILLLMVASTPFLSWLIEVNASMSLPDFLSEVEAWMRSSEAQAAQLTEAFLTFDGLGSLFYVLLIVAVVPAFGEEFLFRGVLQKTFIQWTGKTHLGIWITAILFSALHMQFFGFFPRLMLGVLFGYLFLWSKSLWLPIAGHFINNASVVLISYFAPDQLNDADITITQDEQMAFVFAMVSLVAFLGIMFLIKRVNRKKMPAVSPSSTE